MYYDCDINFDVPEIMFQVIEADDLEDAEFKAIELVKEEFPDAHNIEVNIREVKNS